jgi:hypothetical protein
MNDFKFQLILSMSPEDLLLAKRAYQLKRLISRAGAEGITQGMCFNKVGHGVTAEQFDKLVVGLVNSDWCSRKEGRLEGQWLLTINPAFKDIKMPE